MGGGDSDDDWMVRIEILGLREVREGWMRMGTSGGI